MNQKVNQNIKYIIVLYRLLSILSILYMIIFHVCVKSHALKIGLSDRYLWLISMNVYILHYIGSAFFTHGRKTSLVIFNVELQMEHECFISNHLKCWGRTTSSILTRQESMIFSNVTRFSSRFLKWIYYVIKTLRITLRLKQFYKSFSE